SRRRGTDVFLTPSDLAASGEMPRLILGKLFHGTMKPLSRLPVILGLALAAAAVHAAEFIPREWTIDGVKREALIYVPSNATATAAPLVFVFHGHGGKMQGAARSMPFHEVWPEAIVVFPQGLKTPGRLTDPEGKLPGWQQAAAD